MEGPSLYLLAQELKPFIGKKIKKASGNASFEKEDLTQQKIIDIFSFGKRLIIQLDQYALVTHFLMYGSYRINEARQNMSPRLALMTTAGTLYFYNCSTKKLKVKNIKRKIPFEFDVMSPEWNIKKVIKAIKKHPTATIDDILMDQDIFAGVGNIIKNEVLFLSKISPLHKVSQLSDKKIKEIALNAYFFSHEFLKLRKKFQLKKNLHIYRKSTCPVCGTKVIRKKTGKKQRWSFYCPSCQK